MRGSAGTWTGRPCLICLCVPSNRSFACHCWSLVSCFFACRLDMPDCDYMLKTVEATGEDSEGAIVAAHGGMSPESAWCRRQVEGEARGRWGWEGEADSQGVGQGRRRNRKAEKRLMEGLRESGRLRRPNSQALPGSGRGHSGEARNLQQQL
jgi:hypothetical protein